MLIVRLWPNVADRQQVLIEHVIQDCALVHIATPYVAVNAT